MDKRELIKEYLNKTGQSEQDLFAGASQTGIDHVVNELIPKALEQNKIIVWKDINLESGQGEYLLQDPT